MNSQISAVLFWMTVHFSFVQCTTIIIFKLCDHNMSVSLFFFFLFFYDRKHREPHRTSCVFPWFMCFNRLLKTYRLMHGTFSAPLILLYSSIQPSRLQCELSLFSAVWKRKVMSFQFVSLVLNCMSKGVHLWLLLRFPLCEEEVLTLPQSTAIWQWCLFFFRGNSLQLNHILKSVCDLAYSKSVTRSARPRLSSVSIPYVHDAVWVLFENLLILTEYTCF